MKRHLYNSIQVTQAASGKAVDRAGCLSAVLVMDVTTAAANETIAVAVSHCDTLSGTYEPVVDTELIVSGGAIIPVAAGKQYSVNIDLIACKQYIKVTATPSASATATYALVLGDRPRQP